MDDVAWIAISVMAADVVVTGAGIVDRDTACGGEAQLWGDDAVSGVVPADTVSSTQRLRRHVSAA